MASVIQVTAPLVIVRDEAGAQHYFEFGSVLPGGLNAQHVQQLLDEGQAVKVEFEAPTAVEVEPVAKAKADPKRATGGASS